MELESNTRTIIWEIENITKDLMKLHHHKNPIISEEFRIRAGSNLIKWKFEMYFIKYSKSFHMHFRLHKVWSLGENFILRLSMNGKDSFQLISHDFDADYWKWPSTISVTNLLNNHTKFSNYQACFKMTVIETNEISSRHESFPLKMSIDDNYYEYLINKSYCDFTLKCSDGIDIPIHRLVLSKKSEVFKKIFELDLIERKNKGFAYCDDIESSTLMDVLRFVYTGSTEIEMTPSILYAAEKYKLDNLKHHCVEKLLKNINVDNAVDIFKAAGKCNVEVLEEKALSFILKHYDLLKTTEKFHELETQEIIKIIDGFADMTNQHVIKSILCNDL